MPHQSEHDEVRSLAVPLPLAVAVTVVGAAVMVCLSASGVWSVL